MSNGLKTAALVSVILMAACLLLVPASADAVSGNIGYGEDDDGNTVRYADASDGVRGKLYIVLDDISDMGDLFSVSVDGFQSVSVAKSEISDGCIQLAGPQLRLGAGEHPIKVTDGADYCIELKLKVAPKVDKVVLSKDSVTLKTGETLTLEAQVLPEDSLYRDVVWSSSDESVVSVKDGYLTAHKAGSADITAECGGVAAVCKVTVTDDVTTYTLKFLSDGKEYKTFQLKYGETIVEPAVPVKDGYRFVGWDPEVPESMPAEDLAFDAVWKSADEPDRTVDNDDGSETEVKEEIITEDGKNVSVETATSQSDDGKITSQTVVKDDGTGKKAQQNVTINADALTSDVVDKALTQAQAERSNLSDPDTEVKTTVSVNVGGTSVSISSVSASKLKDDNADLSVGTVNGKVVLDTAVLGTMSLKSGDLVLNVSSDASGLTDGAKKTVGDRRFVNVTLTAGSDKISDLGGKASVTMDFVLSEGMKAAVYYVDDDGNKTFVESVYTDGKVTFTTGHFSVYMVEEVPLEPEEDKGSFVFAAVVGLIVIGGLVYMFAMRRE